MFCLNWNQQLKQSLGVMRKIIFFILRMINIDPSNRFTNGWSTRAILQVMMNLFINFIRGLCRRIFFGKSKGVVLIGKQVTIEHPSNLFVGNNFIAEDFCEIYALSKKGICIGNKVTIGSFALIRPTSKYGGEVGEGLKVGDNSNIGPYSYIGCSGYIEIGKM